MQTCDMSCLKRLLGPHLAEYEAIFLWVNAMGGSFDNAFAKGGIAADCMVSCERIITQHCPLRT